MLKPAQTVVFTVPGKMAGKERAGRHRLADGRTVSFNPKKTLSLEGAVRHLASLQMRGLALMDGPVMMEIVVYRPTPKSWSKAKRGAAFWDTAKPDWDNVGKLVSDALNGVVYRDDAQIVSGHVLKRLTLDEARATISISTMEKP